MLKKKNPINIYILGFIATGLSIIAILSWFSISVNYPSKSFVLSPTQSNYSVIYENLSDSEISYSKSLVDSLKKDYALKLNQIIFTKNMPYPERCKGCYGLTYQKEKVIYINWNWNSRAYKSIERQVYVNLCHESLHLIIPSNHTEDYSDVNHRIIRDLSELGVCYK